MVETSIEMDNCINTS